MTPPQMLADLPITCNTSTKHNAKGHMTSWTGYKLHIDAADGDIPVSCLLLPPPCTTARRRYRWRP